MKRIKFLNRKIRKQIPGGKKQMNMKLGLIALMAILMAGIAYAVTCTFDQTATTIGTSATHIRGTTQNLSATMAGQVGTGQNVTQCNLTVSSGTITGSLKFNTTAGNNITYCNTTVNTLQLKDDGSVVYTFTMTMGNNSNQVLGSCERIFYPDNGVPLSTLLTPASGSKDVDGKATLTYNCTNASSATLYLEDIGGYGSYAMTEASDVCTYDAIIQTNGFHSFYTITSDGLNETTSSVSTLEVRRPGGPGSAEVTTTDGRGLAAGSGGVIAVGILFWMFFLKKKGKK